MNFDSDSLSNDLNVKNQAAPEERVGQDFSAPSLVQSQLKTWDLLFKLRAEIKPGMSEAEAVEVYKKLQLESGAEKFWHPPKIRFGKNTLCSFREPSDETVRLQENDIFFIDIGPIYNGYEGDCGQTFTIGDLPAGRAVIAKCEEIFAEIKSIFKEKTLSGAGLYAQAERLAHSAGYELVGDGANGHRVSEFPHAAHFRGSLRSFSRTPIANRWILEIQLRDRTNNIGAFFEELI